MQISDELMVGTLPSKSALSCCEAITWIALGKIVTDDSPAAVQRDIYRLRRCWPVTIAGLNRSGYDWRRWRDEPELWPGSLQSLWDAICCQSKVAFDTEPAAQPSWCSDKDWEEHLHGWQTDSLRYRVPRRLIRENWDYEWPQLGWHHLRWLQLQRDLKCDAATVAVVNVSLRAAATQLRDALRAGRVHASGVSPGEDQSGRRSISSPEWQSELEILLDGTARPLDNFETRLQSIRVKTSDIAAVWPEAKSVPNVLSDPSHGNPEGTIRDRGGRPAKFNWNPFWLELMRFTKGRPLDVDRTVVQQHMWSWVTQRQKNPPDESYVRKIIAQLYRVCDRGSMQE